jgi:hypothetical protein
MVFVIVELIIKMLGAFSAIFQRKQQNNREI